jgi:gliding motility-associated-like protein
VLNPNSGQLFPTASMAKSYYVKYTTKGVCPKADSMSLTIKPILTASITGDKTVCRDAIQPVITFKGANGKAPYTFKYSVNGGAAKEIKSKVATDSVTIAVPTDVAGTFVYSLLSIEESSASNCSNTVSGNVTINVNTLPIAQITGNATVCEGGNPPNVTFTGVNGTSPFTFMYAVNGVTQPAISTKNGDYSVNVTQPTNTNATYTYSLIGIKDGSTLGCYQPQNNSITVSVKKLPTATIAASAKSICINGSKPTITFTGANGIQPYTFEYKINGVSNYITSNNGSSAVLDVPSDIPNKYVYELVSVKDGGQFTCTNIAIFAKDSVDVISGAFVDPIEDRTVCKDNNSGVINFTGSTNSTFSWYTNNTTTGLISSGKDSIPNFKGVNTSTNTLNISLITVTPSKGVCKGNSITFKMLVRPNPIPKTSPIKIICPGDSLLIKGITPTGISPDYQYFWTPDATLGCLDCPQVWAKPTKTTEYTFIAKDAFGCVGKDKFTMLVRDTPLIQANDTTLCGETKEITLKGTGGVTYEWSNGIVNGQPFTPNFGVNKYGLTGKDKHGCVYTDTVVVSVLTQPKASFTLSTNEVFAAPTQPASILITNTSINGKKYVFNYGNGDSIVETATLEPKTAIYQYPGVATVGLIVYNGACSDAASLPIIIKKIDTTSIVKLPNVFTPNGDGENDEFMIFVKNPKTVRLTIFNRWGNPVYEITETTPSWDGIINGNLAAEGVYFYEYFIETQSGPPLKGNGYVQLIRK